jgi:hypothetical protein
MVLRLHAPPETLLSFFNKNTRNQIQRCVRAMKISRSSISILSILYGLFVLGVIVDTSPGLPA